MKTKLCVVCLFILFSYFYLFSYKTRNTIEIVHFEWDTDLILTDIIRTILEKQLGFHVESISATPAAAWATIRDGMADAVIGSWLPHTHGAYLDASDGKVDVLNKMTEGVRIGIAVPDYMACASIKDLKSCANELNDCIYGVEPGAGIMVCLENALSRYGLSEFEIIEGCETTMLAALLEAIKNKKCIAITAWNPHCMFQMQNIKYLEDPEGIFGKGEYIAILGKKNLVKEMPQAYSFLSKVKIDIKEMEQMLFLMNIEKIPSQTIAENWIVAHQNEISEWITPLDRSNNFSN